MRLTLLLSLVFLAAIQAVSGAVMADMAAAPSAPELESVDAVSSTGAVVTWAVNPEPDLAGYELWRAQGITPSPPEFHRVNGNNLIPADHVRYTDLGLSGGHVYAYYLIAVNESGERSGKSATRSAYVGPVVEMMMVPGAAVMVQGDVLHIAVLLRARNDLNVPDGLDISVVPLYSDRTGPRFRVIPDHPVVLTPDNPEAVAVLRINTGADTVPGSYEAAVFASGQDAQGTAILKELRLETHVLGLETGRSAMVLWTTTPELELGRSGNFAGRLVPVPPTGETVTLRILTPTGTTVSVPGIKVDRNGYFYTELTPEITGVYRITAVWSGTAQYQGSESNTVEVTVTPRSTRITCHTDYTLTGPHAVNFFGVVYPTPPDDSPVTVYLKFTPENGDDPQLFQAAAVTGHFDPDGHPGSYSVMVDLDDLLQTTPVPEGAWHVAAVWSGDETAMLAGSRSQTLFLPFEVPDLARVIVVAAGDPEQNASEWTTHSSLAAFARETFEHAGFRPEWITVLSADTGTCTVPGIESAVLASGAGPGIPLYVYIVGPVTLSNDSRYRYTLNGSGETLGGGALDQILDQLPPNTVSVLFLDGDHTGQILEDVCDPLTYRNIVSFSGYGSTPMPYSGTFAMSRYFFTRIRQGDIMVEAIARLFGLLQRLPPGFRFSEPMVEIGGYPLNPGSTPCEPNQPEELTPLRNHYIGYGRPTNNQDPQVQGAFDAILIPKYAGTGAGAIPVQDPGISQGGDTGGAFLIWIRCEDPDEDLNGERQIPMLAMLGPDGTLSSFGPDSFEPIPGGGFKLDMPYSLFTREGSYSVMLVQRDDRGNMSVPVLGEISAINYGPQVLLFGYDRTRLTATGGMFTVEALVADANGCRDIQDVRLTIGGYPTDVHLTRISEYENMAFYHLAQDFGTFSLSPATLQMGIQVRDESGDLSINGLALTVRH